MERYGSCWTAIVAAVVLGAAGCQSTTYCIQRSALVPSPAPVQRSASLASGFIEGGVGMDTVVWARPPTRREDRNVGLHVARLQLQGNLLLTWNPYVSLGMSWEAALAQHAVPIAPGLIDAPSQASGGGGPHVSLHFPLSEHFVLDVGCEVLFYGISSNIEYSECGSSPVYSRSARTTAILPRLWLAVGGKLGWSTVTLGVGIRPHPVNIAESVENHDSPSEIEPEIDIEIYPYIYLGWEFHIRRIFHISLNLHQPLAFDPVMYAPIIGMHVRLTQVSSNRRFDHGAHVEEYQARQRR